MLDQGNRTFISSVVFVDIVSYSKKSVSEQITIKDRFSTLLAEALKDTAPEQRIILDTGDGVAMSFLGDPEDALFVSMHMRDVLKRAAVEQGITTAILSNADTAIDANDLRLRIGINLGPVKLVRDFNSQPNIVGDGINVAQRIMSFAAPGQVVVSRSYFDVVSVISDEYAKLFRYEGSRTDKHVREHEIYVVGDSVAAFNQAKAGMADRAAATNPRVRVPALDASATAEGTSEPIAVPFMQDRTKLLWTGAVLATMVLVLIASLVVTKPASAPIASPAITAPAKRAESIPTTASIEAAKSAAPNSAAAPPTTSPPGATTAVTPTTDSPGSAIAKAATTPVTTLPGAKPPTSPVVSPATADAVSITAKPSTLKFGITPWGNVTVDGVKLGPSPPLKEFKLPPGKHKIEVRNDDGAPFVTSVDLKAGETLQVNHKF